MKALKKYFKNIRTPLIIGIFIFVIFFSVVLIIAGYSNIFSVSYNSTETAVKSSIEKIKSATLPALPLLDKAAYDKKIISVANNPTPATTTASTTPKMYLWPPKTVYPNAGAILPFNRIIAYYGNFYSERMGALGEHPEDQMLKMLQAEVSKWTAADPETPAIPAIHYIAVTAQSSPGKDGKYRLRMPDDQIDRAIRLAEKVNGIVFVDIQVGLSTLQSEIPALEKYLKHPLVHLGIDPEFSMKGGEKPGSVIGFFSANDINYAATYLAKLVQEYNLPPKILVIHRFTQKMVRDYDEIKPLPEVQIVMHMDGWGSPEKKIGTYTHVIIPEPIQFTGFKIFYKNDLKPPSTRIMTPEDLLKLSPQPLYIQYQ
jgi:hypothetical protein